MRISNTIRPLLSVAVLASICVIIAMSVGYFAPALAVGPISSVASIPQRVATYTDAATVVPGTTGTDFMTLGGSATMVDRIKEVTCSAVATAAGTQSYSLVMRSTLNTGGTQGTEPLDTPNDPNDPASLATPAVYTAPPATLGTLYSTVYKSYLAVGTVAAGGATSQKVSFGELNDKEPTLRGATSLFAINLGGTVAAGTNISCTVEYTESAN